MTTLAKQRAVMRWNRSVDGGRGRGRMEGSLGLDMARHESIQSAIKNLKAEGQEDPVEYLSDHIIEVIKVSPVISISSTIGDLQGGIAASKYKDNVGLGRSHGETIVEYGIRK